MLLNYSAPSWRHPRAGGTGLCSGCSVPQFPHAALDTAVLPSPWFFWDRCLGTFCILGFPLCGGSPKVETGGFCPPLCAPPGRERVPHPWGAGLGQQEDALPFFWGCILVSLWAQGGRTALPQPPPDLPSPTGTSQGVRPWYQLAGRDVGMLRALRREGRREGRRDGGEAFPGSHCGRTRPPPGWRCGTELGSGGPSRSPREAVAQAGGEGCMAARRLLLSTMKQICLCAAASFAVRPCPPSPLPFGPVLWGKTRFLPPRTHTPHSWTPAVPSPVPAAPLCPLRAALSLHDKGEGATLPVCPVTPGGGFIPHPTGSPGHTG